VPFGGIGITITGKKRWTGFVVAFDGVLFVAGLPDGVFSNQKYRFGKIFEGIGVEKVDMFYGHLDYIMAIWYILWPFGNLVAILVHFTTFLEYCVKKNLATLIFRACRRSLASVSQLLVSRTKI
jgi:hypothetical protein